MEKAKDYFKNRSNRNKYKDIILGFLISAFLLTSCQENKSEQASESQKNKIEKISDSNNKPINIQGTREYKMYKLGLGSIVSVKGDIQKAKKKIADTPELSNILDEKDIKAETIIPIIIKESMMNNNAKSKSGAVGYFQLRPIAVKDIEKFYGIKDLNLNANNPVDNIILGCLYKKRSLNLIQSGLKTNLSDADWENMMILGYNAGPETIKQLFKASKCSNYQEFERFLAKKIGVKKNPIRRKDKTYKVEYLDPLADLNKKNLKTKKERKIAECLKYVAIINGISGYINNKETIQILGKITCSKDTTLFSAVKKLKDQGIFKENASIHKICKIILESNGYSEKDIPEGAKLLVIKNTLTKYIP